MARKSSGVKAIRDASKELRAIAETLELFSANVPEIVEDVARTLQVQFSGAEHAGGNDVTIQFVNNSHDGDVSVDIVPSGKDYPYIEYGVGGTSGSYPGQIPAKYQSLMTFDAGSALKGDSGPVWIYKGEQGENVGGNRVHYKYMPTLRETVGTAEDSNLRWTPELRAKRKAMLKADRLGVDGAPRSKYEPKSEKQRILPGTYWGAPEEPKAFMYAANEHLTNEVFPELMRMLGVDE